MPSRRELIRLSDEEVLAFLEASHTITIVSNGPDGYPHPMPMWFCVDPDGTVRMTTFRKSQKVVNLRRDPRVALLVESGEEYQELKGVVLYGEAELVEDRDVILDTLMRATAREVPTTPEARKRLEEGLARTIPKRIGIRVRPLRVVSWDHAKLGGVY